jgi:2-phospho-L-lactate guanylyltransferase
MDLRVIIPVKPFAEAKQRLASVLNPVQRATLAEDMFRHVFGVASTRFGAENVLVVSRSEHVLARARTEGGRAVPEENESGLNSALSRAVTAAAVSRVLVVASDLPELEPADFDEMLRSECAIAPDHHRRGTNALLWPAHLVFAFGDNSFTRHRAIAEDAGVAATTVLRRGLAQDIDVPDDLKRLAG